MLTRLIDHFLISALNRAVSRPQPVAVPTAPPADHALIGHLLDDDQKQVTAQTVALSVEGRRRHVYVLGATGTGKTNLNGQDQPALAPDRVGHRGRPLAVCGGFTR